MDYHSYNDSFALREKFDNDMRDVEQRRLIRLAKAQNVALRGQGAPSPWAPWSSLAAWAGRTIDSSRGSLRDARAWWTQSNEPQEECC